MYSQTVGRGFNAIAIVERESVRSRSSHQNHGDDNGEAGPGYSLTSIHNFIFGGGIVAERDVAPTLSRQAARIF
jgi:hypothetical protein